MPTAESSNHHLHFPDQLLIEDYVPCPVKMVIHMIKGRHLPAAPQEPKPILVSAAVVELLAEFQLVYSKLSSL